MEASSDLCPSGHHRPVGGWQKVAELVVHDGGREALDDQPTVIDVPPNPGQSREAVHRTVYLQAPRRDHGAPIARLAIVFLTCFTATTLVVLASWGMLTSQHPRGSSTPEVRVVQVEKQVPVPVPVPFRVEVAPTPIPAAAAVAAPRPRPPRVRPPAVAQSPAPAPVVVEAPVPVPVPVPVAAAPAPTPVVPAVAAKMTGRYVGKADGRDVVWELTFGADGALDATIVPQDGSPRRSATGEYKLAGSEATIMLMERGVTDPVVYTGTVDGTSADGRMTSGTRNAGRFSVGR